MSPAVSHSATTPPADRAASTRALTERQMAKLERLSEIGMEIAEAAGRMVRGQADGAPAPAADPGLTYLRAARAVRLTIALQSRLTDGLAALDEVRSRARVGEAARRRRRVQRLIEDAADAEGCDAGEAEGLSSDAWEQLTDLDDAEVLDRPIEAVVALICRDLGLAADWGEAFALGDDFSGVEEGAPSVCFADSSPAWRGSRGNAPSPGGAPSVACGDSSPAPQGSRIDAHSPPLRSGGSGGRRPTEGVSLVEPSLQNTEPPPHRAHIGPALATVAL